MGIKKPSSWAEVEAAIRQMLVERDPDINNRTVELALCFIGLASKSLTAPGDVGRGYAPTISFSWQNPPIEFEVHESEIEFYRFFDHQTEISTYPISPENLMPDDLVLKINALRDELGNAGF